MSLKYFDPLPKELVTPLEEAIQQLSNDFHLDDYHDQLPENDDESWKLYDQYHKGIEIRDSFTDLLNQINGVCKINETVAFEIENKFNMGTMPTQMAMMWCVGLKPVSHGKTNYNRRMVENWLSTSLPEDDKNIVDTVYQNFTIFDPTGKLDAFKSSFDQDIQKTILTRVDGLEPIKPIIIASRHFNDTDSAIFRLIYDQNGKLSEYSRALSSCILNRLNDLSIKASELHRHWHKVFPHDQGSHTSDFHLNSDSDSIINWYLGHVGEVPAFLQWHINVIENHQKINHDEAQPDEQQASALTDHNEILYETAPPKLNIPERRELILKGWLIGKGYKIGDVVSETREEVWNQLKKADKSLFKHEAISYQSGEKRLAPTPEKFFKSHQTVCKFS